jgi:hypothetical protein
MCLPPRTRRRSAADVAGSHGLARLNESLRKLTQPGPDRLPDPFAAVRHQRDDDGQGAQQNEDPSQGRDCLQRRLRLPRSTSRPLAGHRRPEAPCACDDVTSRLRNGPSAAARRGAGPPTSTLPHRGRRGSRRAIRGEVAAAESRCAGRDGSVHANAQARRRSSVGSCRSLASSERTARSRSMDR